MIASQLSGILRMLCLLNHALRNFANGAVIDRSKFVGKGPESSGCRYSRSILIIF